MRLSSLGIAAGSLALGAVLALAAPDVLARSSRPAKPSSYTDARYGFSIAPPAFPKGEKDSTGLVATFFAPAKSGFAPNLGVMVQNVRMSAADYAELSNTQFKQGGFTVKSQKNKKINGRDAILWEYEGKSQGRELSFLGLAVIDAERIFLVTATAPKADYEALAAELKASLDSFTLGE